MEVPETTISPPLPLSPQFIKEVIKAAKDSEEKGYAVIPGVFSKEECDQKIPTEKLGTEKHDQPIGAEEYLFGFKSHQGKEGLLLGGPEWKRDIKGLPLLEFVSPFASSPKVRRVVVGADISDRATKKRRV